MLSCSHILSVHMKLLNDVLGFQFCSLGDWTPLLCFMARLEGEISFASFMSERELDYGRTGGDVFVFQVLAILLKIVRFLVQDHMRQAGDVCFSEVFRDRGGKHITAVGSNIVDWRCLELCRCTVKFSMKYLCIMLYLINYF